MVAAAASSAEGVPLLSTTPCANACSLAAASAPDESVKLPLSRLQLSVSNKLRQQQGTMSSMHQHACVEVLLPTTAAWVCQ